MFCDQKKTSGSSQSAIKIDSLILLVEEWLSYSIRPHSGVEIAFFGGTFTGLSIETQESLLSTMFRFVLDRRVDRLRISTRPDALTQANLSLLSKYAVETVELGVQSMDKTVLSLSRRGHSAYDVISAVNLLKRFKFRIGIQLMPGLPGDTMQKTMASARQISKLNPDFVRIYPTVIIKGTPLHKAYNRGEFHPISLKEGVEWCSHLLLLFRKHKIKVIRIGLQPTILLEKGGAVVAGPYHSAFRHLVESYLAYQFMESTVKKMGIKNNKMLFRVPFRELSYYIGHKSENIEKLKKKYRLKVSIMPDNSLSKGTMVYNGYKSLFDIP